MPALFETESIQNHIGSAEEWVVKRPEMAIAHALIAVAKLLRQMDGELWDLYMKETAGQI
jgi:hypothetical protein